MKFALPLISFLCLTSHASPPDLKNGKHILENTCFACHGKSAVSSNPLWPNLRGQKEQYILKQLNDFRSGKRQDPLMSPQAKLLSEKQMQDVAAYISQLKIIRDD